MYKRLYTIKNASIAKKMEEKKPAPRKPTFIADEAALDPKYENTVSEDENEDSDSDASDLNDMVWCMVIWQNKCMGFWCCGIFCAVILQVLSYF
jgi:hypothetical protein